VGQCENRRRRPPPADSEDWTWITPDGETWHATETFKNHRHFESTINIKFQ
jgi:hypothetical protein